MSQEPVTVGWREDERAGGHVQLSLFVGRNLDARGRAGVITLRVDEWDEIRGGILGVRCDVIPALNRHDGFGDLAEPRTKVELVDTRRRYADFMLTHLCEDHMWDEFAWEGDGVEYMEKAHAAIHAEDKEVAT